MKSDNVTFSIIVPTRNRPDTLKKTLLKIKDQSYANFEVIVVDDGSCLNVKKEYDEIWKELDTRFSLHSCSEVSVGGSGASICRNFGINISNGEFIGFCDDDDYWCETNHLEVAEMVLVKTRGELYVANQIAVLANNIIREEWLSDIDSVLKNMTKTKLFNGYILSRKDFLKISTFPQLNMVIIKKDIVDLIKGFWTQIRYLEDLDFFLRALDKVNFVLYRRETVCVHNVPDRAARKCLVPPLTRLDKCTLWLCVSHHVRASSESRILSKKCKQIEGRWLYNYSVELANAKKCHMGLLPSFQALLIAPSPTKIKNFFIIVFGYLFNRS